MHLLVSKLLRYLFFCDIINKKAGGRYDLHADDEKDAEAML